MINASLRDAGHAAHCHWIPDSHKLADTLASERIELIVLNCDRYDDSIREVIKQKDRYNPELPVIAMQNEVGESEMEAAMRAGACDLVSTTRKSRLQSVVSRELRALRVERALNSTLQSATEYKRQLKEHMAASTSCFAIVQEGVVTDVNDAWIEKFKISSRDELVGMPIMDSFEAESHAALKGALVATVEGKWQRGEKLVAKAHIESGDIEEIHLEFRRIDVDDGPCVQVRIAPQLKVAEEPTKLVHDALKRDPTTLFFHRSQFLERTAKRLQRKPASGTQCLVYIKPDNFKDIRDTVGVIQSEEVLAQFAEFVRKRLQPRDVAGRFEGTSIMALLERGSARDAQVWGQQLIMQLEKATFEVGNHSTHMTCTVGACGISEMFASLEDFVAATIRACEKGKEEGGGVSCLDDDTHEDTKQREFDAIWVKHLKAALMDNRFRLANLPIAGLRSDSIHMYDLLVRMIDEQGNSVLPSEFIPAAERNNMMKNIDRWMLAAAMGFCGESNADRVFVRLSSQSITDASTGTWIQEKMDETGFDCTRLVVQIPEREAARHIKQTQVLLEKLKKLGIGFALEHYGIGKERFQILDLLKPDYIKIDGELMHTLLTDDAMQDAVRKVVEEASKRNIKTIAERVENANAMAVLFQLGLDFMQGHYVHEPEVVLQDTNTGVNRTLAEVSAAHAS
ncbi:MAG: bifunctional diguanylate cyclase/phosphodiesterase [Gammaproteobacteria bacterium]|nr:bifunctional diguanylate cyclase/phosphodiesterase [Gammaproteobacteria bacterium]NNF50150.1 GGDEF domain-containing protein [Woeseiaceae bacterium]MBT8093463.1 bifunctional diguanylate cyclase/phosphodiesterase [Gammaproteobacteria bacterium]MBT8105123.1 bifunctional diguanylate cyclase/phosphodiesterase [Gammaproteobacteria bacterium]NNK25137.1 GGDEF domain-containing protein [Woeseiaceae bacterium]